MTQLGLNIIVSHEGFSPTAYWDQHGKKWTIGYGSTLYPNGQPVRKGDRITKQQAVALLHDMLNKTFVPAVQRLVKSKLNQFQLDALTSFAYNCGQGNLAKSTLLKKVNVNPLDPTIRNEFMKWNRSGGSVLDGLTARRNAEANLYFKGQPHKMDPKVRAELSQSARKIASNPENLKAAWAKANNLNEMVDRVVGESLRRLINERATSKLYHYINLRYAEEMLKTNRIRTCEPERYMDTDTESYKFINGEGVRFLSLTRNGNPYEGYPVVKYGGYGDGEISCMCRLTIDGDALNTYTNFKDEGGKKQNIKIKPIDWVWYDGTGAEVGYPIDGKNWMMASDAQTESPNYYHDKMYSSLDNTVLGYPRFLDSAYSDTYHHPYAQAEERILTKAPYIPNANRYITAIDIYVRKNSRDAGVLSELEELMPTIRNIKSMSRKLGIPCNVYTNIRKMRRDRILQKK